MDSLDKVFVFLIGGFILLIIGGIVFANIVPNHYTTKYAGYVCTSDKEWGFVEPKLNCYILQKIK